MLLTFSLVISMASAQQSITCPAWKNVQPLIQNLQKVVNCNSHFTAKECQENLGLGRGQTVAAAGLGTIAVGGMAARNTRLKAPVACGLMGPGRSFLFESVAWAACNSQIDDSAKSIASVLTHSNMAREAELGSYLTEKLAKENPELDRTARQIASTFHYSDKESLDSRLKKLNETLKPMGVRFKDIANCEAIDYSNSKSDLCMKLLSLSYSHHSLDVKIKVAGNADRLKKFYPYDEKVSIYENLTTRTKDLINRVERGAITNEAQLLQLLSQAGDVTHSAVKGLLADSANFIARVLPNLKSAELIAKATALSKVSSEFLAKNAPALRKILPFGLGSLLGLAGGANAAEVAVDAVPIVITAPILGGNSKKCGELYSRYAPPESDSGQCGVIASLNTNMVDFLGQSEEIQQTEICKYSSLETAIRKLNHKYFPPDLSLNCGSDQISVQSKMQNSAFYAGFKFQGENIRSAQVRNSGDSNLAYEFEMDPALGTVVGGKLGSGRSYTPINSKTKPDALTAPADDFSSRQVLAHLGRHCCQSGASDSCNAFKTKTGISNSSTGQSAEGTH